MALSPKRKRWLIIVGSILMVLIILIIFANNIISRKVDTILREELSKIDTTQYVIDYDRLRVNIFSRSVRLYGIQITPSEEAIEKLKRSNGTPPVIELSIDRIRIASVAIMAAIKGEEINIGNISLRDPEITVYGKGNLLDYKGQGDGQGDIFSSDTLADKKFKGGSLGSFEINHANFRYIDLGTNDTSMLTNDLNISVDDIVVHQVRDNSQADTLEIGDINIEIGSHFMGLPGGFYTLESKDISASYKDGRFEMDSLKLIPSYPIGKFSKAFGMQTDRFDIVSGQISITGIIYDSLPGKKFIADEIMLHGTKADICRDKRVARDMSIFPKLFQTALADLPIQVNINSLSTRNANVKYKEIVEDSKYPGMVELAELNIELSGICNYPDSIQNGQTLFVDAHAKLMNTAPLQLYLSLPIGNHAEYFTFHGNVGSFPFNTLNPLLEHLVFVEATGGNVQNVEFYAMAMKDTTMGRLEFKYTDVSITVLKKKKEKEGIAEESKFMSFVAKTAIHKNNPNANKPVRIAKMSFVRDRNKGFFNYVWKTIQNGIVVTLTPGKKNLVSDMGWPDFKSDWRHILMNDWKAKQNSHKKKKKR